MNLGKKLVVIALALSMGAFVFPGLAKGATAAEIQAQIDALLAQIKQLQAQLAALGGGTTSTISGVPSGFTFTTGLKMGMTGDDVKYLQIVLNSDPDTQLATTGVGSPGNETSYFGPLTKAAVIKFQEKYASDVLAPWGLTKGTGFVGKTTRAKLNELLSAGAGAGAGTTPTTPTGAGLAVSLAPDNPAAATLANSTAYNPVLKVNLTAGSADATITGLVVTKHGLTANTNIAGIGVFDADGNRHGNFVTSLGADNTANLNFESDPIVVPAGTTTSITIEVNTASGATSGTMQFSIAKAADITTTATVSGTFPIAGNVMSLTTGSNLAAFSVELQSIGTSTADVGETGHLITKFRFTETGGYEDLNLSKLVLYNNGNANDSDYGNLVLIDQSGNTIATASSAVNKYITFNIDPVYVITRGTAKDLTVKGDILGGSGNTIDLRIMETYDIVARGSNSGYGILTSSTLPTNADTNKVTINTGSLTVSRSSDSRSGKIPLGGKDIELAKFNVKAFGEDFELRSFYYSIQKTSGGTDLAGTVKVLDSNGSILYSVAGSDAQYVTSTPSGATSGNWAKINLSNYKTIKAGTTETLTFVADISSSAANTDTYQVYVTEFYGKRLSSLDYYTRPDTSGFTLDRKVYGNSLTVEKVVLTASKNAAFANPTVVGGATGVKIASFVLQATAVEDVNVTSMQVKLDYTNGSFTNVQLKTGDTPLGSPVASPADNTYFTVSMNLTVPAGGQKVIDVYSDVGVVGSTLSNDCTVYLGTITSTGASSGATVTSPSAQTGQVITISTGGTLTLESDTTNTPVRAILTAGSLSNSILKFKVSANAIENLTLNKLYIGVDELTKLGGVTSTGNVTNVTLKDASGNILAGPASPVNGQVSFAGLDLSVPKATSVELEVDLDITSSGTMTPGALVYASPVYAEYTGTGGVTVQSGGVYSSYTASTDKITVYNIGQFENGDAVRIDADGDGDFADTSVNGFNETTTYYVCSATATTGSAGTIQLQTSSTCGGSAVDITSDSTVDGWISPVAIASNRMVLHDVEPTIALDGNSLSGTQSPDSDQDIATFDITADGQSLLIVKALSWTTGGDYVAGSAHSTPASTSGLACAGGGWIVATARPGFEDTYTIVKSGTDITVKGGDGSTLESLSASGETGANVIAALNTSKYVTAADGSTNCSGNVNDTTGVTMTAASNNGGMFNWKVKVNGTNQPGILYAQYGTTADDTFFKVSASTMRTDAGTNLTFVFTNPITISAGTTATFAINVDTSAVKAGVTSGTKTASVKIFGADDADGEWLGGGASRVSSSTLGGLRWDYTNLLGKYGSTGTGSAGTVATTTNGAATCIDSSASTALDISDSYVVNGNTITY